MSSSSPDRSAATSRLVAVGFDAIDPHSLAEFWNVAFGWEIAATSSDSATLSPTDGTEIQLQFRRVFEPKRGRNRVHLDLTTSSLDDQHDTVARLIGAGASHIDVGQRDDEPHVVLADLEGNELCVIEPGNRFLAGCKRLGAINCDGTSATGYFWSAALGWPLVWDQDQETAIRSPRHGGPMITWSGPPLLPKLGRNRLHLDLAADRQHPEIDRLVSLGATRIEPQPDGGHRVGMVDPDDNEFYVAWQ